MWQMWDACIDANERAEGEQRGCGKAKEKISYASDCCDFSHCSGRNRRHLVCKQRQIPEQEKYEAGGGNV